MNWKCFLRLHDWSRPSFTRTKVIYECKRCHKTKIHFIPPKVILMSELTEIAVHGAVTGLLYAIKQPELAKEYLKGWNEAREKNKRLDNPPFSVKMA
ncbi:hypothetical protein MUP77_01650 [Candidatus Bathyarchaeota archaeon]|nr:hypothetical protein [Candidatus Bathyarchaeota archaeon]